MSDRKVAVIYYAVGTALLLGAMFGNGWRTDYSPEHAPLQAWGGFIGGIYLAIAWWLWALSKGASSSKPPRATPPGAEPGSSPPESRHRTGSAPR